MREKRVYRVNYKTIFSDLPSAAAVVEDPRGKYETPEAAWREIESYATSQARMKAVSIERVDLGRLPGTEAELRQERCWHTRKLRRAQQWVKFAKARC